MRTLAPCALTVCAAVLAVAAPTTVYPPTAPGVRLGAVLVGRADTGIEEYKPLVERLQFAFSAMGYALWVAAPSGAAGVAEGLDALGDNATDVILVGHSMNQGGVAVQDYVAAQHTDTTHTIRGAVFLAGFLQRTRRPGFAACIATGKIAPKRDLKHPGGILDDHVHDCPGAASPAFPVPTLAVGGELDGVVRVTRFAEAFHTQRDAPEHAVVVVPGVNHGVVLGDGKVFAKDIKGEVDHAAAIAAIADLTAAFADSLMRGRTADVLAKAKDDTAAFLAPMVTALVDVEGSWLLTSNYDEAGASPWAAEAQRTMVEPLAPGVAATWGPQTNAFHLLSDEENIPPYFRGKHRANVVVDEHGVITTSTVAQLRYLEVSLWDVGVGLNGFGIIKEEKQHVLAQLDDTGGAPVAAIEIATKLVSRQLAYNRTGQPAPNSLDDGNRCGAINQRALDYALAHLPNATRARYQQRGKPMVVGDDLKPTIPAGPFWIWAYLKATDAPSQLTIQSYLAFYALDANPYGAGNHYCKLLSPARAMEWMYVDSLRA